MTNLNQYYLPAEDVNEDKATIVEIYFQTGEKVTKEDLIYTFETTKATVEVKAEHEGFINYFVNKGQIAEVGSLVCEISKYEKSRYAKPIIKSQTPNNSK